MKIYTADLEKRESDLASSQAEAERQATAKKAEAERQREAQSERAKASFRSFADKAKRNEWEIIALYYSWVDEIWELGTSGYGSPYPFTTIGAEAKFHFNLSETAHSIVSGTFSPSVGIVFPLFDKTLIFANAMLTIGAHDGYGGFDGYKGILRDWMTPSFDAGLAMSHRNGEYSLNIKYRHTLYDGFNYSAIGVGYGGRF